MWHISFSINTVYIAPIPKDGDSLEAGNWRLITSHYQVSYWKRLSIHRSHVFLIITTSDIADSNGFQTAILINHDTGGTKR